MKIKPSNIDRFIKKPDPAIKIFLFYGPNIGLVSERAKALASVLVPDVSDPFAVSFLGIDKVKDDPSLLFTEFSSLSLTAPTRLIWVKSAGDALTKTVQTLLDDGVSDAPNFILLEGGPLPAKSSLRKLTEASGNAAALACYADEGFSLKNVVVETLREGGVSLSPDALQYLLANMTPDRLVVKAELEKILLYAKGETSLNLQDVEACIASEGSSTLDEVLFAVSGGNLTQFDQKITRLFREGIAPVALVRTALSHFQRFHRAVGAVSAGTPVSQAALQARPPVFFKYKDAFAMQIQRLSPAFVENCLERLLRLEYECKIHGEKGNALCYQALLGICAALSRRR
ncbi:MAG: DNA polymerase III subunit delta [Alphaproteobacteria bacterium]